MSNDSSNEGVDRSVGHSILASPIRRAVLRDLQDRESDTVAVKSLVHSVPTQLPDDENQSLRVTLHHTHLPKLDTEGIVDYNADQQAVSYIGDPTVEQLLATDLSE